MGLCFSNVTAFENGERVMIKAEWQSKWQRSLFRSKLRTVSKLNGFSLFSGAWCVVNFFCYHCVLLFVSVCGDSFLSEIFLSCCRDFYSIVFLCL